MKAMIVRRYGGPEVFEPAELPSPVLGAGEVLVRVRAALATPADCAFRAADPFIVRFFAGLLRPNAPVLGDTFAGTVEANGAGSLRFAPGTPVFGTLAPETGCYAQYLKLAETGPIEAIPQGVSFSEAAALADGYMTAITFLRDEARIGVGTRLLVIGAAGAVGSAAIQLGRYYGAKVTGTCSARHVELVRSLGADRVLDYTRTDYAAASERYDVVFDAVGKSAFGRARRVLVPEGRYLTTVPSLAIMLTMLKQMVWRGGRTGKMLATGLRPIPVKARDMAFLVELIGQGALHPVIDRVLPLADIAAAHRHVETGHKTGNLVIEVD